MEQISDILGTNALEHDKALHGLSRDHYHALLFCRKIRTGLKSIDHDRLKKYANYYFKEYLHPHFEFEEKHVFPLLGEESELAELAIRDHRKLRALFEEKIDVLQSLIRIESELEKHIRLEETVMVRELHRSIPEQKLAETLRTYTSDHKDHWEDKFWESN